MQDWAGSTVPESTICWVTVSSSTAIPGRSLAFTPAWYLRHSSSLLVPWFSTRTFTLDCEALYLAAISSRASRVLACRKCQSTTSTGPFVLASASSGQGGRSALAWVASVDPDDWLLELQAAASTATAASTARSARDGRCRRRPGLVAMAAVRVGGRTQRSSS